MDAMQIVGRGNNEYYHLGDSWLFKSRKIKYSVPNNYKNKRNDNEFD